jgi:chitinase
MVVAMLRAALAASLVVGCAGPVAPPSDGDIAPGDGSGGTASHQWVLGYYTAYDLHLYPIDELDWTGLTHAAFAGLQVHPDRTLDFSFFDERGTGAADARLFVAAAHGHGVKAMLMLGGAGTGTNIAAAATPAHRAELVGRLIDALDTLGGYDGIDLDWEDAVELDDLIGLAHDLRAAKPDLLLSYPAGAINGNIQTVDPRFAQLAQSLDRFMVQTYYPSTAVAGQGWSSWFSSPLSGVTGSTPIAIDDTLARYVAAGVPTAKLGMGISFYAICYTGGVSAPRQLLVAGQDIVGGDGSYPLSAMFAPGGTYAHASATERRRDEVTAEPYLSLDTAVDDPHCGASTRYISFEDEASIIAKGAFSRSRGYGGIIIWTINLGRLPANAVDGRSPTALFQALKRGFLDP